mgnify:CR=1 FL=1
MNIGIIGKPNTGKSTFFNAITLASVQMGNYPFTTIEPNVGIAYVKKKCVCKELGVKDNPKNSICINGNRFIPFKIIDTAGLVPGSWEGKGLGNHFLDKIARSDALIHVIDASGSTDLEGKIVGKGDHDPINDVEFLENEITYWLTGIIERDWDKTLKKIENQKEDPAIALYSKLSGLGFNKNDIYESISKLETKKKVREWKKEELINLSSYLLKLNKPIVIAANKIDKTNSIENYKRLTNSFSRVYPVSSMSELILRRANEKGVIKYTQGDSDFTINDPKKLNDTELKFLNKIKSEIMTKIDGTGLQQIFNEIIFNVLKMIVVYPVANHERLEDNDNRILPDVHLIRYGSTVKDLAEMIHTDIAKSLIHAIDAKNNKRVKLDHVLQDNDVIQLVSANR